MYKAIGAGSFLEAFINLLIHRAVAVIYCCLPLGLLKEQVKLQSCSSTHMPHTCAMILSALLCRSFSHLPLVCFITVLTSYMGQEIEVLRTLNHPNIVQYYGSEVVSIFFTCAKFIKN